MILKPKHILVMRFSAMGDVAMVVPVLRALQQQHKALKITVLTRDFLAPLFRNIPNTTVFSVDFKNDYKGVLGLYKLSKQLKTIKVDAIADLHGVLRTHVLKHLLRRNPFIKIDKGRKEKKALTSGKIFYQLKTTHERYVDVFNALGYPIDLSKPIFPQKAPQHAITKSFSKDLKTIGIAPFASHKGKVYPLIAMENVITLLSKHYNILLFGGKYDIDILNNFEKLSTNVINISGKFSLDEELNIISNLDLMLSMDSANAHLAAMLNVKVVTIWGVTHPFCGFSPYNQPEDYMLLADRKKFPKIPTSVYGNLYPEAYANAAGSISPETVVKKIISILNTSDTEVVVKN